MTKYLFTLLCVVNIAFAQRFDVALITSSNTSEHWKMVHAGALKAQKELKAEGVDVNLVWEASPTAAHIEEQKQIVQKMVAKKVAGIVLAPGDVRALAGPVEEAAKAKIPTVLIDAKLASGAQVSYVGTDNFKGGLLGAKRLGTLLGGKGKVALFRAQKGRASTDQREAGFLSAMKSQYPGIQIVSADVYAGASADQAQKHAEELLKSFGKELDGVFASNSTSTNAMLAAVRAAGLSGGKLKFVGFDANSQTLAAIKAGEMQGIVAQNPTNIGYLGVKTLVTHLKGGAIEKDIETSCVVVTPENIGSPAITALIHKTSEAK